MRQLTMIFMLLCSIGSAWAQDDGLDIYFVRHAETVANVTGDHSKENSRRFSAEGTRQIEQLTEQLTSMHFDAILVSPTERTLNTILPYLKKTEQKAVIFPEFAECCWQKPRDLSSPGELLPGKAIELDKEQENYFVCRHDENATHRYANESYADGVAQVHHGVELLKKDYFDSGKTILIVAHYHSGLELMADLMATSRDKLPGLQNGKLIHLHQDKDGKVTLLSTK